MTTFAEQNRRAHDLTAADILERCRQLGPQDHDQAIVVAKFFDPCGSWTWYVTSASIITRDGRSVELSTAPTPLPDHEDIEYFGLVDGFERELGYFSANELAAIKTKPFGLGIERDIYWTEQPLSALNQR